MVVYRKYVRRLDRDERDALWRDYRVVGRPLRARGSRDAGDDRGLRRLHGRRCYASGDLFVTPQARELATDIVLHPPVPLHLRPLLELVNQITVGLLPRARPPPVRLLVGPAARASRCTAAPSTSSAW